MKRLIAYVSGRVQKVGYRARVIEMARAFGIKGTIENLSDGRVRIIAEGDDERLKWFESVIDLKNTLIQVSSIEKRYAEADGEFAGFSKIVAEGETDSRLDTAASHLKELIHAVNKMNDNLGGKMDTMMHAVNKMNDNLGGKMDVMIQKQDTMIQKQDMMIFKQDRTLEKQDELLVEVKDMNSKQDELLVEVKDMNRSMNDKADLLIKKQDDLAIVKADIAEIKTALKAKGIM